MSNGNNKVYSGRKFVLTMVALVFTFAGLFLDKISGGEAVALVPLILGIFTGGNVASKYVGNGKSVTTNVSGG
jgi:hypothetical protein